MEWINLHVSVLDSPAFVGADPQDRATWLCLLRFCIGQENGGVIEDCRSWGDRRWQQVCRVTRDEVLKDSELWSWDEDAIEVAFFPHDKQEEIQTKREGGKVGGQTKSEVKTTTARINGTKGGRPKNESVPNDNPSLTQAALEPKPKLNPTEGKGREGNKKEKEPRIEWEEKPKTASSGHLSFPSKTWKERLRFRLNRHGSSIEFKGKRIDHEWLDLCRPYHIEWIEKIFDEVDKIKLPSDLRRCLNWRESKYDAWLETIREREAVAQ